LQIVFATRYYGVHTKSIESPLLAITSKRTSRLHPWILLNNLEKSEDHLQDVWTKCSPALCPLGTVLSPTPGAETNHPCILCLNSPASRQTSASPWIPAIILALPASPDHVQMKVKLQVMAKSWSSPSTSIQTTQKNGTLSRNIV
jgi:hypothetical protein